MKRRKRIDQSEAWLAGVKKKGKKFTGRLRMEKKKKRECREHFFFFWIEWKKKKKKVNIIYGYRQWKSVAHKRRRKKVAFLYGDSPPFSKAIEQIEADMYIRILSFFFVVVVWNESKFVFFIHPLSFSFLFFIGKGQNVAVDLRVRMSSTGSQCLWLYGGHILSV